MAVKTNWYKEAVVYQIYPLSYMDSNNDGIGDIPGIISKLDYIKDLGATAIWFSPLYDSPWKDYGYDIADYRKIHPAFGTMEDFERLIAECHRRGLRVMMDAVFNHTSDQHAWFKAALADKDSPYRDYYMIREGRRDKEGELMPPTNWTSSFTGPAWERIEGTDEYYLHLFAPEQPDLNWENPKVREEMADVLRFWLEKGVDGFRFDVFNMISKVYPLRDDKNPLHFQKGTPFYVDGPRMHEFLQELNDRALSFYDTYTVGESYVPDEEHAHRYINEESGELDTIFDFEHLTSDNMLHVWPQDDTEAVQPQAVQAGLAGTADQVPRERLEHPRAREPRPGAQCKQVRHQYKAVQIRGSHLPGDDHVPGLGHPVHLPGRRDRHDQHEVQKPRADEGSGDALHIRHGEGHAHT